MSKVLSVLVRPLPNSTGTTQNQIQINEVIPVDTTFVFGSLKVPTGLIAEYSTNNGSTWSTTEPTTGVTNIRVTGQNVTSPATGLNGKFSANATALASGSGGGDGWRPILYSGNGKNYVCAAFHHYPDNFTTSAPHSNINCFDKITGTNIAGYPKYFSSVTGVDTSGRGDLSSSTPADIATAYEMSEAQIGSKLYLAGQTPNNGGVLCWDFAIDQNCGFVVLNNIPHNNADGRTSLAGVQLIGNKVYAQGNSQMYCADAISMSPCAGQPYSLTASGIPFQGATNSEANNITMNQIKNRYIFSRYTNFVTCFDTQTNAICTGWTNIPSGYPNFLFYNTSSTQYEGICTNSFTAGVGQCKDENFNNLTYPTGYPDSNLAATAGSRGADSFNGKVYIGNYNQHGVYCFDWATNGFCPSFGTNGFATWGNTSDYAYNYDKTSNCMYELGHEGKIVTFDPNTGVSPCVNVSVNIKYTQVSLYCDGLATSTAYDKLKYTGNQSALNGINTLMLSVYDKNGIMIKAGNLKTTGSIDISDIPFGANVSYGTLTGLDTTELTVSGSSNEANASALNNQTIAMVLNSNKDPQICFNTKVSANPVGTKINNTATLTNDTTTVSALASLDIITNPATLTGQIYLDANNNGVQNPSEPNGSIPTGTTVVITDTNNPTNTYTATLNPDGTYSQVLPAGTYSVKVTPPTGYTVSVSTELGDGIGANPTVVTLATGETKSAGKDGLYMEVITSSSASSSTTSSAVSSSVSSTVSSIISSTISSTSASSTVSSSISSTTSSAVSSSISSTPNSSSTSSSTSSSISSIASSTISSQISSSISSTVSSTPSVGSASSTPISSTVSSSTSSTQTSSLASSSIFSTPTSNVVPVSFSPIVPRTPTEVITIAPSTNIIPKTSNTTTNPTSSISSVISPTISSLSNTIVAVQSFKNTVKNSSGIELIDPYECGNKVFGSVNSTTGQTVQLNLSFIQNGQIKKTYQLSLQNGYWEQSLSDLDYGTYQYEVIATSGNFTDKNSTTLTHKSKDDCQGKTPQSNNKQVVVEKNIDQLPVNNNTKITLPRTGGNNIGGINIIPSSFAMIIIFMILIDLVVSSIIKKPE